MSELINIEIN